MCKLCGAKGHRSYKKPASFHRKNRQSRYNHRPRRSINEWVEWRHASTPIRYVCSPNLAPFRNVRFLQVSAEAAWVSAAEYKYNIRSSFVAFSMVAFPRLVPNERSIAIRKFDKTKIRFVPSGTHQRYPGRSIMALWRIRESFSA